MKTHVVKITRDATLAQAVDLMDLYFVTGLSVVDEEARYCGLLLDEDVLRAVTQQADSQIEGLDARLIVIGAHATAVRHVDEVMRRTAVTISEHDDVRALLPLLLSGDVDRVPVLDDLGRVVGVVYRVDVLQALFEGEFEGQFV